MFKSNLFNAISFNPFQRCFKKINPFGSFWRLGSQVFISPLWFPGLFLLLLLHLFTGDPSLGPVPFLGIVERPTFMPRWSGCTIWFCLGSGEDMHATFQIQQKFCRFCPKKMFFQTCLNHLKTSQNIFAYFGQDSPTMAQRDRHTSSFASHSGCTTVWVQDPHAVAPHFSGRFGAGILSGTVGPS